MVKIDEFIEKSNKLFEEENAQALFTLCQEELKNLAKIPEFSDEERSYAATIYSTLAQILEPEDALKCLDSAVNYMPCSADLYWQRADIKIDLNDYSGAEEDYNVIIENAPCEEAFEKRGNLYFRHVKNLKAAIKDYTKAIEFNPNSGSYFQRGMAKHEMNDFMGALADYTKTIKLYPNFLPAYKYRADVRVSIGWVDGAIEDFTKILEFEPEDEVAKRALSDMQNIKEQGGTVMKCTLKTGETAIIYQSCIR